MVDTTIIVSEVCWIQLNGMLTIEQAITISRIHQNK